MNEDKLLEINELMSKVLAGKIEYLKEARRAKELSATYSKIRRCWRRRSYAAKKSKSTGHTGIGCYDS